MFSPLIRCLDLFAVVRSGNAKIGILASLWPNYAVALTIHRTVSSRERRELLLALQDGFGALKRGRRISREDENVRLTAPNIVTVNFGGSTQDADEGVLE